VEFKPYRLFLYRQLFGKISVLVTERDFEGTQMRKNLSPKNLSPSLGLSNGIVFQKNHVILHSRQCFEDSVDETLALLIPE
jgi:hypothetical protein